MGTRTAITGGHVVTASDTFRADVLVEDGVIVAVGSDLADGADSVVDATGKLVMPGGIDVHTHLDMPFGGTTSCDDFTTGHIAALHGGTTTHVDFALQGKGLSLADSLDQWHARASGKAVMDYGFHMAITDARPEVLDEIEELVAAGVPSFKLFLAYPGVLMVDDDTLHGVMERAAASGALVMMHAENGPVIQRLIEQALERGDTSPGWHWRTRPSALEGEATERAIAIAGVTGAPLYVVHVTCTEAANAIERARDKGMRIWGETCPQYLYLSTDELDQEGFEGAKYVCSPPLRTPSDQATLWRALQSDILSVVSTDHCPFRFADQKTLGQGDFSKIPNGMPVIEERMGVMSTAVHEGRLSWNRMVELCSTAPAKLFGMHPTKGTVSPGADADLVLWDPNAQYTWSANDIKGAVDYTPFEGRAAVGRATHVWSRGELLIEDGAATAAATPGRGRFVHRTPFTASSPATLDASPVAATAEYA